MLAGACLYLGTLSVIMAVRAVSLVSSWNGKDRATEFAETLRALQDSGLSASGAESSYKVMLTVLAVLAACGAVFAVYTARGDRASRVGLTVAAGVAGLLTFLGGLGGTFLFSMVGALAVVFTIRLWTGETRTYFRTLAGHEPPAPKAPVAAPLADPFAQQATPPAPALPRPVGIAAWTAFAGSVIVAGGAAMGLLALGLMGDDYEQMMRDSPFSQGLVDQSDVDYDQLYRMTMTLLGIFLPLALAGLAASILVLTRKRAGTFLFVMSAVTIVPAALMFPFGLPWMAAAIVCLVQLRKPAARAWFAASPPV
jgi:hypothetical protein